MLTFNGFLRAGGLDPKTVRLVRHTPDAKRHRRVFDAAIRGDPEFATYQETQGTAQVIAQFRAAQQLASFVVDPTNRDTVFIGVWDRDGERPPGTEAFDSVPNPANVHFDTKLRPAFDEYRGRLIVKWGDGERAWVQRADLQDKPIDQVLRRREEPRFPGFRELRLSLEEVERIPASWAEVLRNARGIYLIVHRAGGDQYVGSACGAGGFYSRWLSYADGHAGNVGMRELGAPADCYDVIVLEDVGSGATDDDILARESFWKVRLGTRVHGLNRN